MDKNFKRTILRSYNPKKCNTRQRAIEAVRRLLSNKDNLLDNRLFDDCFEMGDGLEVVKQVLKILKEYEIKKFDDLGLIAQWYACRCWWIDEKYKNNDESLALF